MDGHYEWIPSIGRWCLMFASVTRGNINHCWFSSWSNFEHSAITYLKGDNIFPCWNTFYFKKMYLQSNSTINFRSKQWHNDCRIRCKFLSNLVELIRLRLILKNIFKNFKIWKIMHMCLIIYLCSKVVCLFVWFVALRFPKQWHFLSHFQIVGNPFISSGCFIIF
jgi:hypothetical protein